MQALLPGMTEKCFNVCTRSYGGDIQVEGRDCLRACYDKYLRMSEVVERQFNDTMRSKYTYVCLCTCLCMCVFARMYVHMYVCVYVLWLD